MRVYLWTCNTPGGLKKASDSHGARVKEIMNPLDMNAGELDLGPLGEQCMLLVGELSP